MSAPYFDPEDDDTVELAPLVQAVRKYVPVVMLVTLVAVLVTAAVNVYGMHDIVERRSAQQVRLVFRGAFELVNGGEFRIGDVVDRKVLARVYARDGLEKYLPLDTFVSQVSMVGTMPSKGEYAIRLYSAPDALIPETMVPSTIADILAEWGRGIIRARGELSDGSSWSPNPVDLTAANSVLVKADTARRQVKRYILRVTEVAGRPMRVPEPVEGSLTDIRMRIEDRMRSELDPLLLELCRAPGFSDSDRSFLEARLLRVRIDVAEANAMVRAAEQVATLTAPGAPSKLTPSDPTAAELQRRKVLGNLVEARRQASVIESELGYYQALIAASVAPRRSGDAASLSAAFDRWVQATMDDGKRADVIARAILGQSASMEGIDYVLGNYTSETITKGTAGTVKARAFLAFLATPLLMFPLCLGFHFIRRFFSTRTATA